MKLIKIHIDNFGTLSNFDLSFDEKLTTICEDNGKGKTTIATFIIVMLYGMSRNLKDQKDRERFYPFNGGTYGGRLVFVHEGDTFEIWRQFHKSSKAKDTTRVLKNRLAFALPEGKEIGEEVLGIDEDAFRRVCFINNNGLDFSGESIASKLGGLAGDFDAVQAEGTIEKILTAIKEIKPLRGNGGLLGDAEASLSNTEFEISRLNELRPSLMHAQQKYHEDIAKRNGIRKTIASMQSVTLNEERKKNAQALLDAVQKRQKEYEDLMALYPNGIPTDVEIERVRGAVRDVATSSEPAQELSAEESERLKRLSIRFVDGAPSQEKIEQINADIGELESLSASLSFESKPSEAEEDIIRRFSANPPSDKDVTGIREKLALYRDVSLEYENTDSTLGTSVTKTVAKNTLRPLSIALIVIGAASLIGGVVSCFFLLALGIALIAAGLICVGIGVALLLKGGKARQVSEEERVVNPKKQALGERKDSLRREIATWLSRYYIHDPDPISGMAKFESEYRIFQGHLQHQESKKSNAEKTGAKVDELRKTINEFFRKYGYHEGTHRSMLLVLQKDIGDFEALTLKKQACEASESKRREQRKNAEEVIEIFCNKYGIKPDNLAIWLGDASKAEQGSLYSKNAIAAAQSAYDAYIKKNPISDGASPEFSLEELQAQESQLNQAIAEAKTSIDGWEKELESLDGLLHDQQELKDKIAKLKRRHKILSCVKKNIERAQEAIKEQYVGPIKKEFERYSNIVRETSGLAIDLDANLELRYYANGEYRKSLHLSDGEKMLVSFCLRLALLESMYKGSEVFAILDDPFITLDGTNLPKVLNALGKLAGSTQILYFTCHESRKPA